LQRSVSTSCSSLSSDSSAQQQHIIYAHHLPSDNQTPHDTTHPNNKAAARAGDHTHIKNHTQENDGSRHDACLHGPLCTPPRLASHSSDSPVSTPRITFQSAVRQTNSRANTETHRRPALTWSSLQATAPCRTSERSVSTSCSSLSSDSSASLPATSDSRLRIRHFWRSLQCSSNQAAV
jgi:hypothetical protein